ncbi:TPR and ankyrin repeat-containing protein 1, partial [Biomphalaria glabrata]
MDNWITLMKTGNALYRLKEYTSAGDHYMRSIELLSSSSDTGIPTDQISTCLAKRYGNCSECFYKTGNFTMSLEYAKKCVKYSPKWFKGHLRVCRAYRKVGKWKKSMSAIINAFNCTDPTHDEEIQQKLLYELVETSAYK